MSASYGTIRGTLILAMAALALGWFVWWRCKTSDSPVVMILRWAATAFLIYTMVHTIRRYGIAPGFICAVGISGVLAILWVPAITASLGNAFGNLYTGGSEPDDPKPFYSVALAQRTQGHYAQALAEVRKQLERFSRDFEGQMLMASLQAENLDDLPGAETTIERFLAQPGHAPVNLSYSLNLLADWHLKINKDRDSARAALERIIQLLPDSEMSLQAAQRIGRLAATAHLLAPAERRRVKLHKGVDNVGLMADSTSLTPAEIDPQQIAADYVKHLQEHPLDGHIRERLAILYANHYRRLDLAADQLDQLIQLPNQPAKQIVHWLNLLADLQIKNGAPIEAAHATLQRIIDQYPDLATANNTRRRMDLLKLEVKALEKSQDVQLGTYEQNIGLTQGDSGGRMKDEG